MSKAGKILVGLTAVFALFMLCMALLGGVLLFVTSSAEEVNGGVVNNSATSAPLSNSNAISLNSNVETGFNFANILGELVKLVALIAVIGGVLLLFWHRPVVFEKAPTEPH